MNVTCAYYANDKRLALVLSKLALRPDVAVYPVYGTFVYTATAVRCLGDVLEFLVISKDGSNPVLLTTTKEYEELNRQTIKYDADRRDNVFAQALNICIDKAVISGNEFTMECVVDGCTVVAAVKDGEVTYTIKAPSGEGIIQSSEVPAMIQRSCRSIRKFKYRVTTDTCDKEVTVSRGQVEVFREIAHYVNKSLVFTKVVGNKLARLYSITATGCCEVLLNTEAQRIVKLPFTKATVDPASALSAIDVPLDAMLKSSYLMQSMTGGRGHA